MFVKKTLVLAVSLGMCISCQSSKNRSGEAKISSTSGQTRSKVMEVSSEIADDNEIDVAFWLSRQELESKWQKVVQKAKSNKEDPKVFGFR